MPDTPTPAEQRAADVLAELEAYRAEDLREREWDAFCRKSDVRCLRCDLRYGERDQYGCGESGRGHEYDDDELAEAQTLEPPAIPPADPAGLLAAPESDAAALVARLREAAREKAGSPVAPGCPASAERAFWLRFADEVATLDAADTDALRRRDTEQRAAALREAADALPHADLNGEVDDWLRDRADALGGEDTG